MAKVLIIDDDEHVAGVLKSHLSDEGYEVDVASRGADGMAQARRATPDLIMLDVMLPDATGFQLCKEFRKAPATRNTPILMMSGVARYPNQREFGLERGANEYLLKPFEIIEVGELVNSYIKTKRDPGQKGPAGDTSELRSLLDQAIQENKE